MSSLNLSLPEEKAEKLTKLLERLADSSEAIEDLLTTIDKLKDTGLLAGLKALSESFEEGFNYMIKPELLGSIGNMMMLIYFLSKLDHSKVYEFADKVPECLNKAYEEFKNSEDKKAGLFELIKIMRSPEFFSMLKAMQKVLRCLREKNKIIK